MNEVSEAVCKCFLQLDEVKDIKFHPFTDHDEFLLLRIKDIEALEKGVIPDTTSIEASGDNTLKLFGLSKVPPMAEKWMWKDLKERIQGEENRKWIDEIEQSMKSAGKGYLVRRKETIFQSPHTSENYIPMLQAQRISKTEPKTFEFRISLIRQPTKGVLAPASDSRYSILLSCLILSYRFHWEVCKPYLQELHDFTPDDENDGYLKLKQIQETIDAIERESEYRRDFEATPPDPLHDRLLSAFRQSSEEHARVRENLDLQKQCKQDLKAEIKQKDTHGIIKQLQRLQQLNNQLAVMIAEQYDAALKELGTPSNRYNFNGAELEKEQE